MPTRPPSPSPTRDTSRSFQPPADLYDGIKGDGWNIIEAKIEREQAYIAGLVRSRSDAEKKGLWKEVNELTGTITQARAYFKKKFIANDMSLGL